MHAAFTRLGYNPLHTGMNYETRPLLCDYKEGDSTFDDVVDMLEENGWDSAMEEPIFLMYKQFMVRYPDSKFVLPMRDSQSWYDSYMGFWKSKPLRYLGAHQGFSKEGADNCSAARYFGCDFTLSQHSTFAATKDTCIEGYETHVKRVQQIIPADRLLLFNLSDGYEPLCEFLGVEVPTYPNGTVEDFPHDDVFGKSSGHRGRTNVGNSSAKSSAHRSGRWKSDGA
jgi:hypothetical protein